MPNGLWAGLGWALGAAVLFGITSVMQAAGARHLPKETDFGPRELATFARKLSREPAWVGAAVLNLVGFGMHFLALHEIPLYLAQAGISVSLVVTAMLATWRLNDQLSVVEWVAVVGVCAGLALLALASGKPGDDGGHPGLVLVVCLAVIGLLGAGAAAVHRQTASTTAVLGSLAGLGFAGVAIAARLTESESFLGLFGQLSTYALGASGLVAFLLYSYALQRDSVTLATTPMIAFQTVTPAVVGVLLLDDGIRAGWFPAAIGGFLLTAVSAVALVRFESVSAPATSTEVRPAGPDRTPRSPRNP